MSISSFFSGLFRRKKPTNADNRANAVTPVPFPEGVRLTGFYMTHQGMEVGCHYIMKTTSAGTYMKITNLAPDDWLMQQDSECECTISDAYLGFADTVKDCEYASLKLLNDDTPVRQLEEAIVQSGALSWDGYNKSVSMDFVLDAGDLYSMYLELSDGRAVRMSGYNTFPAGYPALSARAKEIFNENKDYSRYMAKNFTDAKCTGMMIEFYNGMSRRTDYKLELMESSNRWAVVLKDPNGDILEKNTDIAEYQDIGGRLPYERFLEILSRHNAEAWNGWENYSDTSVSRFTLRLYFADGKEYNVSGSVFPDGFDAFMREFVQEIYRFYTEYGSKNK